MVSRVMTNDLTLVIDRKLTEVRVSCSSRLARMSWIAQFTFPQITSQRSCAKKEVNYFVEDDIQSEKY